MILLRLTPLTFGLLLCAAGFAAQGIPAAGQTAPPEAGAIFCPPDSQRLECRKFEEETRARKRELSIAAKTQQTAAADLAFRKRQASGWNTTTLFRFLETSGPILVAVIAGIFGIRSAIRNAAEVRAAAVASAGRERALAEVNAAEDRRLEQIKAESARILKMIETGDGEMARNNLRMLLAAGLITTPELKDGLAKYLEGMDSPDDAGAFRTMAFLPKRNKLPGEE